MTNPNIECAKIAVRSHGTLQGLFDQLGSEEKPDGYIYSAYRAAGLALPAAIQSPDRNRAMRDVTGNLRLSVESTIKKMLENAQMGGVEAGMQQINAMNDRTNGINLDLYREKVEGAANAIVSKVEAQISFVDAVLQTGSDPVLITGDEDHHGVLRPGDVALAATFWITSLFMDGYAGMVQNNTSKRNYDRMVVATMDKRVTDCCLRAHGQTQPFNKPFILTGDPRFADELDWTPFHWRCRSSVSLYLAEYDDGLTDRMTESASTMLDARANGIYLDYHPADAFIN